MMIMLFIVLFYKQTSYTLTEGTYSIYIALDMTLRVCVCGGGGLNKKKKKEPGDGDV